jgi:hypothetical protein
MSTSTITAGAAAGIAIGRPVFGFLVAANVASFFYIIRQKRRRRKVRTTLDQNIVDDENNFQKVELGTDEEALKRKPTVRYELADEPIDRVELRGGMTELDELEDGDVRQLQSGRTLVI